LKTIVCFLLTCSLYAGDGGKTGFAFLRIGNSARTAAMGEAAAATPDGANTITWNPALLVLSRSSSLSLSTNRWIEDMRLHTGALKFGNERAAWALNAVFTGVDGIQKREIPSEEPTAIIASHDVAIGAAYARRLNDRWAVGAGIRYVYERIESSVHAVGFDAGASYDLLVSGEPERWTIGASLTHAGFSGKFVSKTVVMPATFRLGTQYQWIHSDYTYRLAADVVKLLKGDAYVHSGAEAGFQKMVFLRAGYQIGYTTRSWTAGMGLRWKDRLNLDYAFVPISNSLGNTHRFTIGIDF
jgi:hypothetical protein